MPNGLSLFLAATLKIGAVLLIANEVRGLILAAPIIYAMYQSGGSAMAIWIGLCSLGGVELSVAVPIVAASRLRKMALVARPA